MRGISRRAGGQDKDVRRCGCGAWTYAGQPCLVCIRLAYERRYVTPREGNDPCITKNRGPRLSL